MKITTYTTKKGEKRYILKAAYIGYDSFNKKQVLTTIRGKSEREVRRKLQEKIKQFETSGNIVTKKTMFKEVYEAWLDNRRLQVSGVTMLRYKSVYKKYIAKTFDHLDIEKISTIFLQKYFVDGVKNDNWSQDRVKRIYTLLNNSFKYAISVGLMTNNPILNLIKPNGHKPKEKLKYLTKDELETFLSDFRGNSEGYENNLYYTLFQVLAFTGGRVSEILALKWSDIDFTNNEININKTWSRDENNKPIIRDTTKTKNGVRKVSINGDAVTIAAIKKHKKLQAQMFLETGYRSDFVFFSIYGHVVSSSSVYSRAKKAYKRLKLENIGVHGLRHTHATLLFASGASPKYVQARLGHANIGITQDIYIHLLKEQEQETQSNFLQFMAK
jgi:integrase